MDTRKKIVGKPALLSLSGKVRVAKGWFDILTAEHCQLLAGAKPADGTLVVLVYRETADRPAPLDSFGRAQMVAALGCVDRVCECDVADSEAVVKRLEPESVLDVDASETRDIVRHIAERHGNG